MKSSKNYIEVNKESWNKRTEVHVKSDFYDNENFKKGKCSLNQIELDLLGDISGKSILHLQCHFGQDTISLNRFGAQITGVDLSDKSILFAQQLAEETNASAKFICCNIYDLKITSMKNLTLFSPVMELLVGYLTCRSGQILYNTF